MAGIATSRWIAALLGCLLFSSVQAEAPVWLVDKDDQRLFLGGTIHFLTAEDYPLPNAFAEAYKRSSRVVFETDIVAMQSPGFQQTIIEKTSYPAGRSLKDDLSAETYARLEQHFGQRGLAMDSLARFKPGMVVMTMTVLELQRLGLDGTGVDLYFSQRASSDGKPQLKLETIEDQIEFIANLGAGQEDEMMLYSLADLKKIPQMMRAMKSYWQVGDMAGLDQLAIEPLRSQFPEVNRALLHDRNHAWLPQIEAMLTDKPVEFVLVGAAHLAGESGLLELLRARGYRVRQLK